MPSNVFITQQPRPNRRGWMPNLDPASEFGNCHFVFNSAERPSLNPDSAIIKAGYQLRSFDCEKDFILWPNTGDPAALWAVIMALCSRTDVHQIQFLYWERKLVNNQRSSTEGWYVPIKFPTKIVNKETVTNGKAKASTTSKK